MPETEIVVEPDTVEVVRSAGCNGIPLWVVFPEPAPTHPVACTVGSGGTTCLLVSQIVPKYLPVTLGANTTSRTTDCSGERTTGRGVSLMTKASAGKVLILSILTLVNPMFLTTSVWRAAWVLAVTTPKSRLAGKTVRLELLLALLPPEQADSSNKEVISNKCDTVKNEDQLQETAGLPWGSSGIGDLGPIQLEFLPAVAIVEEMVEAFEITTGRVLLERNAVVLLPDGSV